MLIAIKCLAIASLGTSTVFAAKIISMALLAEVSTPLDGYVEPIISLVTTGGFGAMLWYLVVKRMPSIEEAHRMERAQVEQRHRQEREDSRLAYFQKLEEFGQKSTKSMRVAIKRELSRRARDKHRSRNGKGRDEIGESDES